MASAVAKKKFGVVITSSPDCTPSASRPKWSAAVPLLSATQCLTPQKSANSRSKGSTSSPCTNDELRQTRSSAGRISSRNSAYSDCRSSNGIFITPACSPMQKLYCTTPCATSASGSFRDAGPSNARIDAQDRFTPEGRVQSSPEANLPFREKVSPHITPQPEISADI